MYSLDNNKQKRTHHKAGCLKHSTANGSTTTASRTESLTRGCTADTEVAEIARAGATERELQ